MDRALSQNIILKRKYSLLTKVLIGCILFIVMIISIRLLLKPSIHQGNFFTSMASRGDIETTISASGIVQPEFEEIKISPVQSRIIQIYHNTGDKVIPGDSILSPVLW